MIACEAVVAGNCRLLLSDDNCFIQTVIESYVVRKCFSKALKETQYRVQRSHSGGVQCSYALTLGTIIRQCKFTNIIALM